MNLESEDQTNPPAAASSGKITGVTLDTRLPTAAFAHPLMDFCLFQNSRVLLIPNPLVLPSNPQILHRTAPVQHFPMLSLSTRLIFNPFRELDRYFFLHSRICDHGTLSLTHSSLETSCQNQIFSKNIRGKKTPKTQNRSKQEFLMRAVQHWNMYQSGISTYRYMQNLN